MKKAIIWSFPKGTAIQAVELLKEENEIDIVAYFSRDRKRPDRMKELCHKPNTLLKNLKNLPLHKAVFPKLSRNELERYTTRFLDTYSRVNFSKGRNYHELLNLFHLYLNYFLTLINEKNVDIVIFIGTPHIGVDFILYFAAKISGIPVSMSAQSHLPNRFYVFNDLDDFGHFRSCPGNIPPTDLHLPDAFQQNHFSFNISIANFKS